MSVSPRMWMSTFVALVFMIGLATGVLVDRTLLGPDGRRGASAGAGGRGDGAGPARGGRGGPLGLGGPLGPLGPLGPPPERFVADLARELNLSDAQRDRVRAILTGMRPVLERLQEESRASFLSEQRGLDLAIVSELTPDQAARYREIVDGLRAGRRGRGRE